MPALQVTTGFPAGNTLELRGVTESVNLCLGPLVGESRLWLLPASSLPPSERHGGEVQKTTKLISQSLTFK